MSTSEIQLEGKENVNGRFEDKSIAYAYALDPANSSGAPVSYTDANAMVSQWWADNGVGPGEDPINIALAFNKQLLLLMLSQNECEGLRFYFCTRPDNQKQSLVVIGVDKAGNDLGQPLSMNQRVESIFDGQGGVGAGLQQPTIMAEVGSNTGRP